MEPNRETQKETEGNRMEQNKNDANRGEDLRRGKKREKRKGK